VKYFYSRPQKQRTR